MTVERDIDLFAGPGGWDEGAAELGVRPLGVEWDDAACATRRARGHETLQADVSALDPREFAPCRLMIASAPCQAFSMAGKGEGRKAIAAYIDAIEGLLETGVIDRESLDEKCGDPRGHLVLEPLRWAMQLRPRFVALEQVEPVLPLWEAIAVALRRLGYGVWTGVLSAERYGSVATCPVHDPQPAPSADGRLSLTALASADPAGIEWVAWLGGAESAARRSTFLTDLASVHHAVTGSAIGSTLMARLSDAWAVASLARGALDAASDAVWRERVLRLLYSALPGLRIPRGRVATMWAQAATCEFGWTDATGESIAWSPSVFWAALCSEARSFTTSMRTEATTRPATSGSSVPTPRTCFITGGVISRDECSLCDDYAVPQTRRRAILLARLGGEVSEPPASHQRYVPPRVKAKQDESLFDVPEPERIVVAEDRELLPWVSMAEALGWGMTARPSVTVASGGSGSQAAIEREQDAGAWCPSDQVGFPRRADDRAAVEIDGQEYRRRDFRRASEPAFALAEKARSAVRLRANAQANACERSIDEPAPAITGGHDTANRVWVTDTGSTRSGSRESGRDRDVSEPAPTVTSRADQLERRSVPTHMNTGRDWKPGGTREDAQKIATSEPSPAFTAKLGGQAQWVQERPATTVAGDPRVFPPGHKLNDDDLRAGRGGQLRGGSGRVVQHRRGGERLAEEWSADRPSDTVTSRVDRWQVSEPDGQGAVRVSVAEASVLQSFPPDYPWQGSRTAQYRQIGDAVPPLLARAILTHLLR